MNVADQALPRPWKMTRPEKVATLVFVGSVIVGILFPFPVTKYILGVVLGLTFVYVATRGFYLAVSFFCFLLPLQVLASNNSFLIPGLNVQTGFVLMFILLAIKFSAEQKYPPAADELTNPLLVPVIGLLATVVVSAGHSSFAYGLDLGDQLARVKNWFSYSILAFLGFRLIIDRREKLFVLASILIVTALNAAYSLRDILMNPSLNVESNRAVSFIALQPNLYAGFLVLYSFFFLSLLIYYPLSKTGRVLVSFGAALVLINLVYTLSRGAWLAFMVTAVVISATKSRRMLLPLLLIAGTVYFWLPDVASDRFQSSFEGQYDPRFLTEENVTVQEAASRIVQWKTFLPLLAERPIVGVGFGRYGPTIYEKRIDEKPRSAHSSIIEIGIEEGLIGLAFYIAIILVAFSGASRIFRESSDPVDRTLALGFMAATLALLLLDVTGTRFRNSNIMAFYWILAGITLNAAPRESRTRLPSTKTGAGSTP